MGEGSVRSKEQGGGRTSVTEERSEGECKSNDNRKKERVEKKSEDGFPAASPGQSQHKSPEVTKPLHERTYEKKAGKSRSEA